MIRIFGLILLCVSMGRVGAAPEFQLGNIFPPGAKHSHSSSVVECSDGSLLACWFYGSGERTAEDVVVQGARWNPTSSSWGPVFEMADTPGFPDCNPVLWVDQHDRVWLFWITVLAERWECSQLKFRRANTSAGPGPPQWAWQGAIHLKPGERFPEVMKKQFDEIALSQAMWAEYAKPYGRLLLEAAADPYKRQTGWMTRIHPLMLPSGRILLPLYSDGFNAALMAISDDQGETWIASDPIVGRGPIQPSVVRRRDGTLIAYCRDSGSPPGRVMAAHSRDEGLTWSAARDIELANPGSSLEVIGLKGGQWLYVGNDTEEERNRLSLRLSADEGASWSSGWAIEPSNEKGQRFGYPSVIQARDGRIHLTYTYTATGGKCIRHATVNVEWLRSKVSLPAPAAP